MQGVSDGCLGACGAGSAEHYRALVRAEELACALLEQGQSSFDNLGFFRVGFEEEDTIVSKKQVRDARGSFCHLQRGDRASTHFLFEVAGQSLPNEEEEVWAQRPRDRVNGSRVCPFILTENLTDVTQVMTHLIQYQRSPSSSRFSPGTTSQHDHRLWKGLACRRSDYSSGSCSSVFCGNFQRQSRHCRLLISQG